MKQQRKLAAIMFTDIEGFSGMMQDNETKAIAIKDAHREVLRIGHERFNGRITQHYGDGTLSIFQSAVEAVECAVFMQIAFIKEEEIPVRIGLHLGDIVCDDDNIYGDGVNLASRIESLGLAGCILISDKVEAEIHNHPELRTVSMGKYQFKNISHRVEVFAMNQPGLVIPRAQSLIGKTAKRSSILRQPPLAVGLDSSVYNNLINSIAVLPFINMSAELEQEHFGDCIAEEVLSSISKIEGLKVAARSSSFKYRDGNRDLNKIRKALGVTAIVDGCVRRYNGRFRIIVQLVSSSDGFIVWSEKYDNGSNDLFAIQEEIAMMVTKKLQSLMAQEGQHILYWGSKYGTIHSKMIERSSSIRANSAVTFAHGVFQKAAGAIED